MNKVSGSFRDPSGFLFEDSGSLLRQVNRSYRNEYDLLVGSGLYEVLKKKGMLIPHRELDGHAGLTDEAYKIIQPERIPFISYPYEWSFTQLQDAALMTLNIQKIALDHGMSLKDASAYNIQFHNGKPVFIDSLSFERYEEGRPWVAYGQFCRHFLAPLALMSYSDVRLSRLLQIHLDGLPLDMVSAMLPWRTRFSFSLLIHIHLHAASQKKYKNKPGAAKKASISKNRLHSLIVGLKLAAERLRIRGQHTEWANYYTFTNYSDASFNHKKKILSSMLKNSEPDVVWDLGANTGIFSQIAADMGARCIAFDIDPLAVDAGYRFIKKNKTSNLLPLVIDLTNPSPGIGWNHNERMSLKHRNLPDTVLALALIHHLAISDNIPLEMIARFMHDICSNLIIEFVPKSDSQVQKLLASRKDVFPEYHEEGFRKAFEKYFEILEVVRVDESDRILFRMRKR